jgi:hypothetical protein
MAYRGWRDMKFVGGFAEAHVAGRRFKGPKGAQRREMDTHAFGPMTSSRSTSRSGERNGFGFGGQRVERDTGLPRSE